MKIKRNSYTDGLTEDMICRALKAVYASVWEYYWQVM